MTGCRAKYSVTLVVTLRRWVVILTNNRLKAGVCVSCCFMHASKHIHQSMDLILIDSE